ncbi:MAG: HAD family hydrolase [Synergistaceae bacterium]|nr:HAD family hydrolase [Synergistaceae bacterium]
MPAKPDGKNRAVFLDRDGVILEERGYLSNPEEVTLLKGAPEAIRKMAGLGLKVVVVTNQSGIGRGLYSEDDYRKVKERMEVLLAHAGARTDAEYHCPHAPWEACGCRKPSIGLVLEAAKDLELDLSGSFVVGDKLSDIQMGRGIGARTVLVRSGYGRRTERNTPRIWDAVAEGILEAADIVASWVAEGRISLGEKPG